MGWKKDPPPGAQLILLARAARFLNCRVQDLLHDPRLVRWAITAANAETWADNMRAQLS